MIRISLAVTSRPLGLSDYAPNGGAPSLSARRIVFRRQAISEFSDMVGGNRLKGRRHDGAMRAAIPKYRGQTGNAALFGRSQSRQNLGQDDGPG